MKRLVWFYCIFVWGVLVCLKKCGVFFCACCGFGVYGGVGLFR